MRRGASVARAVLSASIALGLAGCAARPLPRATPLRSQNERDLAWDSRTCAWAAQDASGYDPELSAEENTVVDFFVRGRIDPPARPGAEARDTSPAAGAGQASPLLRPELGGGGPGTFEQEYRRCMAGRGYEVSRWVQEEKVR